MAPTIVILATGGTVANPPDVDGYVPGREVVDAIPELDREADIEVRDVMGKASSAIGIADWIAIGDAVETALDEDPDGIVITHGSNSMEETAYVLNLVLDTHIPVALTAAQRNFRTTGNDGNRNLLDAVRTVADPRAVGKGVLVVVNDQIHGARDVTKTVSGRPDAWSSGDFGPLGLVDKDGVVGFYRSTARDHTRDTPFSLPDDEDGVPTVEIAYSAVGIGGRAIVDAVDRGVDGLVLAAYPTGSPDRSGGDDQGAALERAVGELPVVVSHRGLEGWPSRRSLPEDCLWGDTLTPQKARILLGLGLRETDDTDTLQRYFETC